MQFAALISGGKDSIHAISELIDSGNELKALIHISSENEYSDSYMYQTVGSEIAILFGEAFGVPIFISKSKCNPINQNLEYERTEDDEVEDLYKLIKKAHKNALFTAVCSGAILSKYQKNRVESVCNRLNLTSLAPLWQKDQKILLQKMIENRIDARIIKIASPIFTKECLGMNLTEIYDYLSKKCKKEAEINFCGEGGEYETIVFDCKHFKNKIVAVSERILNHPEKKDKEDGVFFIKYDSLRLESKK